MTDTETRYKEALERIREHGTATLPYPIILDWVNEALNLPQEFEEVEVVRYLCIHGHIQWDGTCINHKDTGPPKSCCYSDEDYHCNEKEFITMKGTYRRPVKPKVKRREEVGTMTNHNGHMMHEYRDIPKTARLIAEWDE